MKLILALLLVGLQIQSRAQAPITVLGMSQRDKVLASFWAQQGNTPNTIAAINANNGSTRWEDDTLPLTITGSGRSLSGKFTGTNAFAIQTYSASLSRYDKYTWDWISAPESIYGVLPADTNTVSRVGMPEPLLYKDLFFTRFANSSGFLSGALMANGTNQATATPIISGTASFNIGGATLKFTNGVMANWSGETNVVGTGITNLNALTAAQVRIITGNSGSDFNITTSESTNIVLNIPTASASARGLLSASDWSAFSGKADGSDNITAFSAFNQNGIFVQVSPHTFAGRLIVSSDGTIEVVNGDGVSGDIDLRVSDNGYFYIRTITGTPSDPPPTEPGKVGAVYDTDAHRLWIYDSGWRSITFSP